MSEVTKVSEGSEISSIINILSPVAIILVALLSIVAIIALGIIFKKHNRNGLLAIIPLVNMYILLDIFWNKEKFGIYIILSVILGTFVSLQLFTSPTSILSALLICGNLLMIVLLVVWTVMLYAKMAKAYGYGTGFTIGLLLLYPIFVIILARKTPVNQR